jgi:hypothetical protein
MSVSNDIFTPITYPTDITLKKPKRKIVAWISTYQRIVMSLLNSSLPKAKIYAIFWDVERIHLHGSMFLFWLLCNTPTSLSLDILHS